MVLRVRRAPRDRSIALLRLRPATHCEDQLIGLQKKTGHANRGVDHAAVVVAQVEQKTLQARPSQPGHRVSELLGCFLLKARTMDIADPGREH